MFGYGLHMYTLTAMNSLITKLAITSHQFKSGANGMCYVPRPGNNCPHLRYVRNRPPLQLLEAVMWPCLEWKMSLYWAYQEDNDPKHTAKYFKSWFSATNVNEVKRKLRSPDLS
ncbi:uncharacterized protein LOC128859198 [Anastrepha ludens]|uniref:uncharacterized protein LOC128859198 n=1 Tax=Anastrepha ludens TaxID=28586 RepID=UPI0023B03BA2|nr:uncharacterized protein LOC128859198 [Anastrepha ludens]